MNVILDTLFLRKPRLEYVSPPICEALFSSSGSPIIMLDPIAKLRGPTGGRSGGRGGFFLSWGTVPGQLCFSIYFAVDPFNPNSPYNLISECIPPGAISLCSPGWYQISAIDGHGVESPKSSPIQITDRANVTLPLFPHTVAYNLYKSTTSADGPYSLYWYGFSGNSFEVCVPGCYRLSGITLEGETPLSDPVCTTGCTPYLCPQGLGWNDLLCECVPCDLIENPCEPGFIWNSDQCQCIASGGGGGDLIDLIAPDSPAPLGQAYSSDVLAVGGTGPYTWTLVSGALPDGLTADWSGTDISLPISGTPTKDGDFSFTVACADSVGDYVQQDFTITVSVVCDATTDWINTPGVCRLRVASYVDGLISGNQCGSNFFVVGSGQVWDGTFPGFNLAGPGDAQYLVDPGTAQVSGFSTATTSTLMILFYDPGNNWWTLQVACQKQAGGAGSLWIGQLNGSSPIGDYVMWGGCALGPATITVEAYTPTP